MEALLLELCARHGWCGALQRTAEMMQLRYADSRAIVAAIVRAEGRAPDPETDVWLAGVVDDWLFDADGRGARSGLPR
jgi:hypothetical protein